MNRYQEIKLEHPVLLKNSNRITFAKKINRFVIKNY